MMDVNMEQENEDVVVVVVVAASTILLACGSQQLATKNRRKRSVWMKNWLMERHVKGAYNALLVDLPCTAMQDYKRFMRMNEETFKVSSKSTLEISVIIVNIFDGTGVCPFSSIDMMMRSTAFARLTLSW